MWCENWWQKEKQNQCVSDPDPVRSGTFWSIRMIKKITYMYIPNLGPDLERIRNAFFFLKSVSIGNLLQCSFMLKMVKFAIN